MLLAGYWSAPQVNLACNYVQRFSLPVTGQDSAIQAVFPLARCVPYHPPCHPSSYFSKHIVLPQSSCLIIDIAISPRTPIVISFPQHAHLTFSWARLCYLFPSILIVSFPQHAYLFPSMPILSFPQHAYIIFLPIYMLILPFLWHAQLFPPACLSYPFSSMLNFPPSMLNFSIACTIFPQHAQVFPQS